MKGVKGSSKDPSGFSAMKPRKRRSREGFFDDSSGILSGFLDTLKILKTGFVKCHYCEGSSKDLFRIFHRILSIPASGGGSVRPWRCIPDPAGAASDTAD